MSTADSSGDEVNAYRDIGMISCASMIPVSRHVRSPTQKLQNLWLATKRCSSQKTTSMVKELIITLR